MHRLIKTGEGILLGSLVLLLFLLSFENIIHVPNWLKIFGRMHTVFLHFPIVLLLLSFITLWLPAENDNLGWMRLLRLIAALTAVITAIMGLLLSLETDKEGSLLVWHKWTGISLAIAGFIFYISFGKLFANKIIGKTFSVAATLLVIVAGHFGGDLTHGKNYLLEPVENNEIKKVSIDQAVVFEDIIKPIFTKRCGNCHGDGASKGGLLLVDSAGVWKGGKTGPLFVPGEPLVSLLLKRIHLPEDDKKHMPPRAKAQLSEEEIAILTAWIRSGGIMNKKLISLPPKDSFRILAASLLEPVEINHNPKYDFAAADEKKVKELTNNYRVLEPLGIGSPALSVYFYGKAAYSKKSLEELLSVKKQIVTLSLSRMPVKDEELSIVNQFSNLEKLNLNYTDITGKGLVQLTGLQNLSEFSISGTAITSEAVEKLLTLLHVQKLVIWDTKIDTLQVLALRKKFAKMQIENGFVDDGKFIAILSAPIIETQGGVFDTLKMIKMKHPFRGVTIRYTLDGSVPDSADSKLYKDSFSIQTNTELKVRAFKSGWTGSSPVEALYIKRGFIPDSVGLITPPDPKYNGVGKVLEDKDLGDLNFGNGKWLGYMNNPAIVDLYFNKPIKAQSLLVNLLKRTEQHIFLPVSLEVWVGPDKAHLSLLRKILNPIPAKNEPNILVQQAISFPPTAMKCIRIIAKPIPSLPEWHKSKGKKGWAFLSEIVVN